MSCFNFVIFTALAGLDFSAIRVPNSGSGGSLSSNLSPSNIGGNGGNGGGGGNAQQSAISIGMNDDPAIVREEFFKNPDQLALVCMIGIFVYSLV